MKSMRFFIFFYKMKFFFDRDKLFLIHQDNVEKSLFLKMNQN